MLRLPAAAPLTPAASGPWPEERTLNKPITFEMLYGAPGPRARTSTARRCPASTWLDDGEHFLQRKDGRLYKVHAQTGRCQPFFDTDKVVTALAALPTIDTEGGPEPGRQPYALNLNPQHTGGTFRVRQRSVLLPTGRRQGRAADQGARAARRSPTFSPDGRFVAHVRDGNLYVTDVATQTERP